MSTLNDTPVMASPVATFSASSPSTPLLLNPDRVGKINSASLLAITRAARGLPLGHTRVHPEVIRRRSIRAAPQEPAPIPAPIPATVPPLPANRLAVPFQLLDLFTSAIGSILGWIQGAAARGIAGHIAARFFHIVI